MTGSALTLRHLCFTGPQKEPAILEFGHGLNVIYGASETGKSFIVEALDFMLGSTADLRDIPERVGYDRIFLGIQVGDGTEFTLERSTAGGQFRCYERLHFSPPEGVEPAVLRAQHDHAREDNLSRSLLAKIGLDGKRIRKNARGETNSLSFRNLAHLSLVSEGDIQKRGSPFETGQVLTRTAEFSTLKLLLTGVDDSAVKPTERESGDRLSRASKIEVIDQLIADYRGRLPSFVGEDDDEQEPQDQLSKLDDSLSRERRLLRQTEQSYREALQRRNDLRKRIETARERRFEVDDVLARFRLLDEHYESDLARLDGIREAGALVSVLDRQACPLCGAAPDAQHLDTDCDGDIDAVVNAAGAEIRKISRLRDELHETVGHLRREADDFDERTPRINEQLTVAQIGLDELNPYLTEQRATYTEILDIRSEVQNALNILSSISELEGRRRDIEKAPQQPVTPESPPASDVSFSTLYEFSQTFEGILKNWNFPDADHVFFDKGGRDFVIAGKPRGARGKGMRAITHAAFTIGLLEFTRLNDLPHPGFTVLDTPLLAYREPEGDEDDLTGTDVQDRFYELLVERTERQVIVLENVNPPESIQDRPQVMFFSKNPHTGRYGFFPR